MEPFVFGVAAESVLVSVLNNQKGVRSRPCPGLSLLLTRAGLVVPGAAEPKTSALDGWSRVAGFRRRRRWRIELHRVTKASVPLNLQRILWIDACRRQ